MFTHVIQELNRKLNKSGLADKIAHPVDAGFRPQDVADFFTDCLQLENGSFILDEDGFKLILESGDELIFNGESLTFNNQSLIYN
jgi:hypothetical protein